MNKKMSGVNCFLVLVTVMTGSLLAIPLPEKFINDDHKQRYDHCKNQLRGFDEEYANEIDFLATTLQRSLQDRLLELTVTVKPERVRELQKIVDGWFDEAGEFKIGKEVPNEITKQVAVYEDAVARRRHSLDRSKAKEHHWLVRQLDQLALTFEEEEEFEKMRALRAEAQALMPWAGLKPSRYGKLEATNYQWHWGHLSFVRMQGRVDEPELITLARLSGNFTGGGEWVKVQVWDEGGLPGLTVHSMQQSVSADAYALRHPALKMDKARVRTESVNFKTPRVKLIHRTKGFCYLGGVEGTMGDLTKGEVSINPADDFYYLTGQFEKRSTSIHAVVVEYPDGEAPEFETTEAEWRRGQPVKKLIRAEDGICLLTGISGALGGGGEEVRLVIDQSGRWRIGGRSLRVNTGCKAVILKPKGK